MAVYVLNLNLYDGHVFIFGLYRYISYNNNNNSNNVMGFLSLCPLRFSILQTNNKYMYINTLHVMWSEVYALHITHNKCLMSAQTIIRPYMTKWML